MTYADNIFFKEARTRKASQYTCSRNTNTASLETSEKEKRNMLKMSSGHKLEENRRIKASQPGAHDVPNARVTVVTRNKKTGDKMGSPIHAEYFHSVEQPP